MTQQTALVRTMTNIKRRYYAEYRLVCCTGAGAVISHGIEINLFKWWWNLPSGRCMSSSLTLYFLWVLEWPTRPILAVNCRLQSSQVKRLVSVNLAAGMDRLVEPFRRLRFSTAVTIRTSSKCCTPVRQAFCHLDLLPVRSSQAAGSMPVDSRLAFKLSLKRSSGRQLGRVPDSNSA